MSGAPQTEDRPGWRCTQSKSKSQTRTRTQTQTQTQSRLRLRLRLRRLWLTALAQLLACAAPCFSAAAEGAADTATDHAIESEDAARLRALGYVEFATDAGDEVADGVTYLDRQRAAPGHNLIVSSAGCSARLMDLEGRELQRWTQGGCRKWWAAALMRNGDLFVNGSLLTPSLPEDGDAGAKASAKRKARFAARIARTGETRWLLMLRSHHQLDFTPQGEVLVITEASLSGERAAAIQERLGPADKAKRLTLHDNLLAWLSPDGQLLDTLSLLDAVTTGEVEFPFAELPKLMEGPSHVGLFHCNSAFAMNQPHLASTHAQGPSHSLPSLYSEHNVLLTSRNQNRIFIVNRRTRSLVWAWGKDELQGPHYGTWLANGNLLVFDNGIDRGQSRVLEVNPRDGQIVWQYPGDQGIAFSTKTRGTTQRFDNGNTLIVESNAGKAFEITPAGDVVWEYHTPLADAEKRPVIITLRRYPESWLEPKVLLPDASSETPAPSPAQSAQSPSR